MSLADLYKQRSQEMTRHAQASYNLGAVARGEMHTCNRQIDQYQLEQSERLLADLDRKIAEEMARQGR